MNDFQTLIQNATEEQLSQVKNDLWSFAIEILEYVEGIIDEILQYPQKTHNYIWDDDKLFYKSMVMNLSDIKTQHQILSQQITEFIQNNITTFNEKIPIPVSKDHVLKFSPEVYFYSQIFQNYLHSRDLDASFSHEWNDLLKIRSSNFTRIYPCLIQNYSLKHDTIYEILSSTNSFTDIRGSTHILSYSLKIRRMTADEYHQRFGRKLAVFDFYRVSTLIEIEITIPSSIPYYEFSSINEFNQNLFHIFACAINLIFLGDYKLITLDPRWEEKYVQYFHRTGYSLGPVPYKTEFSLGKRIWSESEISRLKTIMEILYSHISISNLSRFFIQLARLPYHIDVDPSQGIVAIWTFFESFLHSKGYEMMSMISWLYTGDSYQNRLDEFTFWKYVNVIRNKYVHGETIESIEGFIHKKLPSVKSINVLIRICQEKLYRIFIRILLYLQQERTNNPDFNPQEIEKWIGTFSRQFLLGKITPLSQEYREIWSKLIKKGTSSELGLRSNYHQVGTFKGVFI